MSLREKGKAAVKEGIDQFKTFTIKGKEAVKNGIDKVKVIGKKVTIFVCGTLDENLLQKILRRMIQKFAKRSLAKHIDFKVLMKIGGKVTMAELESNANPFEIHADNISDNIRVGQIITVDC